MPDSRVADINQPKTDKSKHRAPIWCSSRLALAIVGFMGFVNLYALRVNMSVAMVCMINNTAIAKADNGVMNVTVNSTEPLSEEEGCIDRTANKTTTDGEFVWDKETQGIILGAFFWGYLITQIPGGWLAERFGGKRIFGWFMLLCAVATLLTPVGARASPYLLIVLRALKGIGEGVVFPSMHNMWSKWAPPLERSALIGFTYAGAQIGNVITFPLSGLLCQYGFDGGWGSIFYVTGTFGVIWFILWMFLTSDSPREHPRISDTEKDYILSSIGANKSKEKLRAMGTPWRCFFTSMPVWAIIVGHTCSNWGTYAMLTNIPTYMREVLKFDIKANGAISAVPYIMFWAFINLGGFLADLMRTKGVSTRVVRRIFAVGGTIIPGVFLIATGYINCTMPFAAVALLAVGVGFSGFQYASIMVNHVDIAPPFAGILFGISNTAATIPGILAPYFIGKITANQSVLEWRLVFFASAAIYAFGAIFFVVFCDGELQDWVKPYMFDDEKTVEMGTVDGDVEKSIKKSSNKPMELKVEPEADETANQDGALLPPENEKTRL